MKDRKGSGLQSIFARIQFGQIQRSHRVQTVDDEDADADRKLSITYSYPRTPKNSEHFEKAKGDSSGWQSLNNSPRRKFRLSACCNQDLWNSFTSCFIVTGYIIHVIIAIGTPIAGIIGGMELHRIFLEHSHSEIDAVCNDHYESFVWNGSNLGVHGHNMVVFGIVDLIFLLFISSFIITYCMQCATAHKHRQSCIHMVIVVRVFFMLSWTVFGALLIEFDVVEEADCDPQSDFAISFNALLLWLLPMLCTSIASTSMLWLLTVTWCLCYCEF